MNRNRRRGTTFYCFSPPIMLATFIIEISLLIYVVFRYKLTVVTRLVVAMLFCLGLFQLAEYNVCGQVDGGIDPWSRAGFAAITVLPALGLHLMQIISRCGWPVLKWIGYAAAAFWIAFFALAAQAFDPHVCGGNYIIFHLSGKMGGYFYLYYYFLLLLTLILSAYFAVTASKRIRNNLHLLILGYCVFIVPTLVVNTLSPESLAGVTSIMCGFAVIYAFLLVFAILPRMKVPHRKRK